MNDLFGGVVYAGIDTDRYKYPIGSGRVTFGNQKSFMKAVKAGFVEIKTPKFSKKVSCIVGRIVCIVHCVLCAKVNSVLAPTQVKWYIIEGICNNLLLNSFLK